MSVIQQTRMNKTVLTIAALTDASDETTYWRSQSPQARLAAIELMREVMYGVDHTSARLQRVLAVAQLTSS